MLKNRPTLAGVDKSGPGHGDHARDEEQHIKGQVKYGLGTGHEKTIKHVAAHMAVFGQRVRAGHHEDGAIHHDHRVKSPGMWVVERIARENLPADQQCQHHNEPGEGLAKPGAKPVNREQEFLHGAWYRSGHQEGRNKKIRARQATRPDQAGWLGGLKTRRSGFFGRRLSRRFAKVAVVGHAPVNHGVEFPAHGALSKRFLRLDDFLE